MTWRYRTINCVGRWFWVAHPGKAEIARAAVPACIRVTALAIPLALPSAAFVPAVAPVAYLPAVYGGPAYEVGTGLFASGIYALPLRGAATSRSAAGPAVGMAADAADLTSAAVGGSPTPYITTYAAPLDVPVWVPGEGGQTSVPEPNSALIVLAGLGVVALLSRVSE